MVLLLALIAFAGLAPLAQAYDNYGFHRAINFMAVYRFSSDVMRLDPSLDNAAIDWYELVYGYDWGVGDGPDSTWTSKYSQRTAVYRDKWMGTWIVDGGYSGDQPENPMALRHFYDPVYEPRYLTDQMSAIQLMGGSPDMDAITWALDSTENQYSFYDGKIYFALALASPDPEKYGNYGKAWRTVGETMHVMADLCNPAHVRNDGHVSAEPMEDRTGVLQVARYAVYPSAPLDYSCTIGNHNLQAVMKDVATWTNSNFFSADTIPLPTGKQANGERIYPLPVSLGNLYNDGYNYSDYYGQKIKAYRVTLTEETGNSGTTGEASYSVAGDAVTTQQSLVIPTAIRASEAVLDAFLPRFTVTVDSVVEKSGMSKPTYTVTARILHIPTSEWPSDLPIRNGAHILITNDAVGKNIDKKLSVSGSGTLNQFSADIGNDILPGDQVTVYYDFGGYRVYSDPVTVTSLPAATQKPTVAPTPAPTYTEAPDMIWVGTDYTGKIGGDMDSINIIYYSKYVFADSQASDVPVSGRIIVDTDGIFSAPIEYEWAKTFQRNTQYKPDTMGVIKTLYLTIPRTAKPGTYTWSITVTDDYEHICTKLMKVTIER
jgi:hypothetical protein